MAFATLGFTYDQRWSPVGHKVAADLLYNQVR